MENKVVDIDFLRLNYSKNKFCKCYDKFPRKKPQFEIDMKNRVVECRYCHVMLDAFEALVILAKEYQGINEAIKNAEEYKRRLISYKPYLKEARRYEAMMREKDMLPVCPNCNEAFEWQDITKMTNKRFLKKE